MPSHTLPSVRRPELQAYRTRKRSREVQPIETKAHAAEIAAQLRALIPCSTDPARLERLAREAEARSRR